jgi:hypothetical protein
MKYNHITQFTAEITSRLLLETLIHVHCDHVAVSTVISIVCFTLRTGVDRVLLRSVK